MTYLKSSRLGMIASALLVFIAGCGNQSSGGSFDPWTAPVSVQTFPDVLISRPDFDSTGKNIVGDLAPGDLTGVAPNLPVDTDQIFVVSFDSQQGRPGQPRCLTCDQTGPNGLAKWSPDDQKILFHSQRTRNPGGLNAGGGFPFDDVWVMNADGSGPTQLTFGDGTSADFHAVWSPDGKQIAWIHHGCILGCYWEPMIADYVEQPAPHLVNERRLASDTSFWETQDFTPDGLLMATVTAEGILNGESFLIDPTTGERVRRLTFNPYWDEQFHPSPDGKTIVQMSARDNPGATAPVQKAAYEAGREPINDFDLAVTIATSFGNGDGPRTDLYLIDAELGDSRIRRLTFLGDEGQVIPEFGWSPDGRHIAWGGKIGRGRDLRYLGLQVLTFGVE